MSAKGDLFAQFGETWTTGKVDVLDDLLPADIAYHLPPFPDMDREAIKQFIVGFHQAFPDFQLTIHEEIVDGNASAPRWSCRGTFSGASSVIPGVDDQVIPQGCDQVIPQVWS